VPCNSPYVCADDRFHYHSGLVNQKGDILYFAESTCGPTRLHDEIENVPFRWELRMIGFLLRAAIAALGLWVASLLLPGISFDSTTTLAIAALLLGVVNAVVRPIAFFLTLPLTVVTLGLFLFVLNAAMVGLVARLLPGFTISGFWTAIGAAVIVWLVSWVGSSLIGSKGRLERLGSKG
jgi:putative membrane protein